MENDITPQPAAQPARQRATNPLSIPIAIVIAGAIIAGALIYALRPVHEAAAPTTTDSGPVIRLAAITAQDHILGNPNAPVRIVEYADLSCPYCKQFNPTMEGLISSYGPSGEVAWVFRHFPLDKPDANGNILHKNAGHEAQALECAAVVGGSQGFWAFEKKVYETTPGVTPQTPDGLDQSQLPVLAKSVGIDQKAFTDCLSSGKTADTVEGDYLSGVNAGVSGTPMSFIVLDKAAPAAVDTVIAQMNSKYGLPDSLLVLSGDRKIIYLGGAMPKDVLTGLISAILGK